MYIKFGYQKAKNGVWESYNSKGDTFITRIGIITEDREEFPDHRVAALTIGAHNFICCYEKINWAKFYLKFSRKNAK